MTAAFGIGKKNRDDDSAAAATAESDGDPLVDFDDPELLNAMEIFANMSPEEMEETMNAMKDLLGNDPETVAAIDQVMQEIPKMKAADVQSSSLKDMIEEDELAVSTQEALKMLKLGSLEMILEKRDEILNAVIESGKIDAVNAARFQAIPEAWESELKYIWSELMKQADAEAATRSEL